MDDTTLDAIEGQARFSALTGDGVAPARSVIALVAEVRRLTGVRAECERQFQAQVGLVAAETTRAESAEAEVVTLRARLAAVVDEYPHADTCGSMLTPGAGYPCSCWQADLRAALATTGEGQHVAREVFTADGIPFVRCSCSTAKSPTSHRWLSEHVPNGGVAELQAVVKRQAGGR